MKNLLLVVFFLFLQGCSGSKVQPPVETVYVKVNVPGPVVPCKVPFIASPPDLLLNLKNSDDIHYKVKVLLADRELRKAYEIQLETAINSCNQSN